MSSSLVVLITGANQGLGFETARHLSKLDHLHVFITGRNAERVSEAKTKLEAESGCVAKLDELVLDVSDDASIGQAVNAVEKRVGRLDVLVNNSAQLGTRGEGPAGLRKAFKEVFEVNVFGAAAMADAFLPLLKKSSSPRIVNVSSGLGSLTVMSNPAFPFARDESFLMYSSSKSALGAITVNLAMVHPDIHVVCISPGPNATKLTNYSGRMHPSEGSKVIVEYVLENKGKSPGFYGKDGEIPW